MKRKKNSNSHNATQTAEQYLQCVKQEKKQIMADIALNPSQSDYISIITKEIKSAINDDTNKAPNVKTQNIDFKKGTIYKKRRINAMLRYIPMYAKLLKHKYPDARFEKILIDLNRAPSSSLPDTSFVRNGKSYTRPITIAISLFILDALKYNGALWEALLYLPPYDKTMNDQWRDTFSDATFPNEIIFSLAYLIEHRDNTSSTFLTPETAKRKYDNTCRIYHHTTITENDYTHDHENAIAVRNQALTLSYRERLDKILSMISPEIIEHAEKSFKHKLFRFVDTTVANTSIFSKRYLKSICALEKNLMQMSALEDNFIQSKRHTETTLSLRNRLDPKCVLLNNIAANKETMPEFSLIDKYTDDMKKSHTMWSQYVTNIETPRTEISKIDDEYRTILYELINGHNHNFSYETHKELIPQLDALNINNPYEIVFAYFYLADKGHDIVWLVEPAAAIVDIAIGRLPWIAYNSNLMQIVEQSSENKDDETTLLHDKHNTNNAYLYERRYNDYLFWYAENVPEISSDKLASLNLSQLIYMASDVVAPRETPNWSDDTIDALVKSGINKNDIPLLKTMFDTNNALTQKNKYHQPGEIVDYEQVDILKKELANKDVEINRLASQLHNAEKQVKNEKQKSDELRDETVHEHKELVELRELIYKIQNDSAENETLIESSIKLPYFSKRNVIVYGGHETWLKTIKSLLPNVRFIMPNVNPEPQLIRNADVIWMQSNAMPHSYYNKIMDIARTYKIPVKYFAYASAEKCAYQLAEQDVDI